MKMKILLCLFVSLFGLVMSNPVHNESDKALPGNNVVRPYHDTKMRIQQILILNIETWLQTQIFLSFIHQSIRNAFDIELDNQLNKTRLVIDEAKEEGKDVKHCFEDANITVQAIKQQAHIEFAHCDQGIFKEFMSTFKISGKIMKDGNAALKDIDKYYVKCGSRIFQNLSCYNTAKQNAIQRVRNFNQTCIWYAKYRKQVTTYVTNQTFQCLHKQIGRSMQQVKRACINVKDCMEKVG